MTRRRAAGGGESSPQKFRRLLAGLRAAPENHLFTIIASLGRLWRRPAASLMTVGVLAIALALPAVLHLGVKNLRQLSDRWEALGEISVFLSSEVDAEEAARLAAELGAREEIAAVRAISPGEALDDFRTYSGFDQALDALASNPLPWMLVLSPAAGELSGASLAALGAQLEELPGVDFAQFDMEWLNRFNALLRIGRRASVLIGAMLAFAVLLIVGNTVRLELQARRPEVEICKILGATDGFVRRPFLYLGMWYGILGGVLACALIATAVMLSGPPIATLASAYQTDFAVVGLDLREALSLVAGGALTGWAGSWIAVGQQLSDIKPA